MPTEISSENPTQSSNKLHLHCNHSHYQCSQFLSNVGCVQKRNSGKRKKNGKKLRKEMGIQFNNIDWKELNLWTSLASTFGKTLSKVSKTKDIDD